MIDDRASLKHLLLFVSPRLSWFVNRLLVEAFGDRLVGFRSQTFESRWQASLLGHVMSVRLFFGIRTEKACELDQRIVTILTIVNVLAEDGFTGGRQL
ncbi:MAG: hypothetical protein VB934_01505, partial [Polyangiaceae bacterium]